MKATAGTPWEAAALVGLDDGAEPDAEAETEVGAEDVGLVDVGATEVGVLRGGGAEL